MRCGREEDRRERRGTESNKRHGPEGNGSYYCRSKGGEGETKSRAVCNLEEGGSVRVI